MWESSVEPGGRGGPGGARAWLPVPLAALAGGQTAEEDEEQGLLFGGWRGRGKRGKGDVCSSAGGVLAQANPEAPMRLISPHW